MKKPRQYIGTTVYRGGVHKIIDDLPPGEMVVIRGQEGSAYNVMRLPRDYFDNDE